MTPAEAARLPPMLPDAEHTDARLALAVPDAFIDAVAERVAARLTADRPTGPEPWVDVPAAAAYLACPRSRLYALVSADRIPHRKDGSRLLFRCSELDAWLDQGGGRRP